MRGLCNINVWRRKSGNSMEGFFHLCHVCREYSGRNAALAAGKSRIPVYRLLIFLHYFPGPGEMGTDSADS